MSVINTISVGDGRVHVTCPRCGCSVGVFDLDEVAGMARSGIVPVCFRCDPLSCDSVPDALRLPEVQFLVVVDDVPFLAVWRGVDGVHEWRRIEHYTWASMVEPMLWDGEQSLSSCTYLNTTKGKWRGEK